MAFSSYGLGIWFDIKAENQVFSNVVIENGYVTENPNAYTFSTPVGECVVAAIFEKLDAVPSISVAPVYARRAIALDGDI